MKPEIRCNDNIEELKKIPDESVDLVYIDPPFNSGKHRGDYDDRFNSMINYVNFIEERITEIHRVLKPSGSFYLHGDNNSISYLRVMLDKVFGMDGFKNAIMWKRTIGGKGGINNKSAKMKKGSEINRIRNRKYLHNIDTILFYTKGEDYIFNPIHKPLSKRRIRDFNHEDPVTGRKFTLNKLLYPGKSNELVFIDRGRMKAPEGKQFMWSQETYDKMVAKDPDIIYWTKNGNPRYKKYLDQHEGTVLSDYWDDIAPLGSRSSERTGYATQKPEKLLERIIKVSTNKGDVILDPFAGSGTTCVVAKRLGRKGICIDQNPRACKIMEERLG